jgi:branched-chain amino acid transport system substrate-binding protein
MNTKHQLLFSGILFAQLIAQVSDAWSQNDKQPIKIGGSFDISGAAAALGSVGYLGSQYAVDELNKKGGVLGRQIEFDHQDNGSNPQRAVTQSAAMANDGAVFLIAPGSSASTIAVSKSVSAKFKLPMCVGISGSPNITIRDFQPYMFSPSMSNFIDARAIASWVSKRGFKRYGVIAPDYEGGRFAAEAFKRSIKQFQPDAEIVIEEYPKFGATDYTASINKLAATKPDFTFSSFFGNDLVTFSRQAQALGFFQQVKNNFAMVFDTDTLRALGNDAPIGVLGRQYAPLSYLLQSLDGKAFLESFKAKSGNYPSDFATMDYDCVMIWAQAVEAAGTTDAEAVIKQIETREFKTMRGPMRFTTYDHQADVPDFIGPVVMNAELGTPILDAERVTGMTASQEEVKALRTAH